MPLDLQKQALWADRALRDLSDPERRRVTSGYFPTSMEILGVSAPKMRTVLRQLLKDLKREDPELAVELAWLLRGLGTHEGRQVAFELLEKRPDARSLLRTRDIKRLGEGNDNWASVDAFATTLAGRAWLDGRISDARVRRWAKSPDLWWRRTALAATVCLNFKSRGGSGDPDRTLEICELLAHDDELMVVKALSWALRSVVPHDRVRVQEFLDRHGEALPALVRREVANKLRSGLKSGKA